MNIVWRATKLLHSARCNLPMVPFIKTTNVCVYCSQSGNREQLSLPVLTLFTKQDCSLCDTAMEELQAYLHMVKVEKVDITLPENKEWYQKYRYDIPVFHLDGQYLMKHKADIDTFLQALKRL